MLHLSMILVLIIQEIASHVGCNAVGHFGFQSDGYPLLNLEPPTNLNGWERKARYLLQRCGFTLR